MNNKITAFTILAFTLGMVATTTAVTSDTNSDNEVTANVTSTIAMDVKPESLDYPDLTVGQLEQQSDRGFSGVEITNTGSEYIDQVWLGTSYPDTNPFGTGIPGDYNAGNFMAVKPDNDTSLNIFGNDSVYHYVNRKDFADSNVPTTINTPDDDTQVGGVSKKNDYVGQARFGDQWIYWYIPTGTEDTCNGGSTEIFIGTSPSDQSEMGSYDFTDSSQYESYDIAATGSSRYGITNSSVTFNLENGESDQSYDVLTACNGNGDVQNPHIVMNKYNVGFNETTDLVSEGVETTYLLDVSSSRPEDMLQPDQSFTVETAMNVPRGVSAGEVGAGSLTVYATADTSAQE